MLRWQYIIVSIISVLFLTVLVLSCWKEDAGRELHNAGKKVIRPAIDSAIPNTEVKPDTALQDTALFTRLQLHLVHGNAGDKWPVKMDMPLTGALLPYNRIVAYYGNFYSKGMGVLGELPPSDMIAGLQREAEKWAQADTLLPVVPALHYIAITAQGQPGKDGKYRLRMPHVQIEKALQMAEEVDGIVFLDVQVGHSNLQTELPTLERYLSLPHVHLGIDPEYSMKDGERPASRIGYFDAADINYASEYLAGIVTKYKLPPKILVVHRFTKEMVTGYKNIIMRPEVQIVMHMDGFGFPAKKINSYRVAIANEPVQFTGFKLFYKNDILTSPYRLMEPAEILQLYPRPVYIQYQ